MSELDSLGLDDLTGPDEAELALIEAEAADDEVDLLFDEEAYELYPNEELLREP